MKKLNLLTIFIMLAFTCVSYGQISGSLHDFSGAAWNSSGEICLPCHTPHNSDLTVSDAPLWNHDVTASVFTVYSSATLNATVGQPNGTSKLCLSCHDGSVAMDSYGGATGSTMMTGDGNLGIILTDDHPISFTYDDALATADGGLFDPLTVTTALGGTINHDLLSGGTMQCSSCHDAHDDQHGSFLLIDNAGSDLCLTCHDK